MPAGSGPVGRDVLPVARGLAIPTSELTWRFSRSSGPGGQGVNTTDSRVTVLWDLASSDVLPAFLKARATERLTDRLVDGVLAVTASEERSQLRNRQVAQRRLAELVAEAIAPPPPRRRATRPSRGSVVRRLEGKTRRSQVKAARRQPRPDHD